MTDLPLSADETATWANLTRRMLLAGVAAAPIAIAAPAPAAADPMGPIAGQPFGFNAAFYLATYPDIKAAGVDPLAHFQEFGKWEGRLPYKGADTWKPTSAADYANAAALNVVVPDVYLPAGAMSGRVRVTLMRGHAPLERSYSVTCYASNADGGNFNLYQATTSGEQLSLPSTGSVVEFTVSGWPAGQTGFFNVSIQPQDTPLFNASARVHIGVTPPAGYVYPDALVTGTPTPLPALGKPDIADALADLTPWSTTPTARQINNMTGVWPDPAWRTQSGKAVNVLPTVNGVRTLAVVDCRTDPLTDGGHLYPYAMPFLTRVLGDGLYGVRQVDADIPTVAGLDPGIPWGIGSHGEWPPELDGGEVFGGDKTRRCMTWHLMDFSVIAFRPLASQAGRHVWTDQRTRPDANGISWYRQWRDGVLIVECPNYLDGHPLNTILSIEGPGGQAAGAIDPNADYGAVRAPIYAVRWWQY